MVDLRDLRTAAAYSRFGLGVRADASATGDSAFVRLLREIGHEAADPGVTARLPDSATLLERLYAWQKAVAIARRDGVAMPPSPVRDAVLAEVDARYDGVLMTPDIGLTERLVMFWTNHFAVSRDKSAAVSITGGAFEREAIRPFVYGRFFDMLLAVETHPAMLYFLDNTRSTGPNARTMTGKRRRKAGLNENLAREILELHTLGVRTGYNQSDVTAFARALTGWTVAEPAEDVDQRLGTFTFRADLHEPGPQTLMGRVYEDNGMRQASHVLRDLAIHPATARHIATKLVRHFISDNPPPALVARLQSTFLETAGDLKAVTRALVQSDEALMAPPTKLRLPQEYLASAMRATGVRLEPNQVHAQLNRMGQPIWQPGGPNGFSDKTSVWATPVSLQARIETVNRIARMTTRSGVDPRRFADHTLPAGQSDATRDIIAHAETRSQGVAIALLSPEFLRR